MVSEFDYTVSGSLGVSLLDHYLTRFDYSGGGDEVGGVSTL